MIFFHEEKAQRWLFRYLLFIFVFVSLFVCEIDPVIANDIILFFEVIFIYFYYKNYNLKLYILNTYRAQQVVFILFMLWFFGSLLSLVFSPVLVNWHAVAAQVPRFIGSAVNVIFAYTLFHFIRSHRISPWCLFFVIAAGAIVTGLNFFLVWNLYPLAREDTNFLLNPPFYINIRQAGFHANAAVCILVGWVYREKLSENHKVISYILLTGLWTYLFWTGGRASSFSAILSFYACLPILFFIKKRTMPFAFFVTVSMLIGLFLAEYLSVLPINGFFSNFDRHVNGDLNTFSGNRIAIWQACIVALENNWLFGLGAESYMFLRNAEGELLFSTHPHNVIMQFVVEWGVFGLFVSLTFLSLLFYKGLKNIISSNGNEYMALKISCFMLIISFSTTGLVDGTYYHAQTVMCLLLSFTVWLMPEETLIKTQINKYNSI